jgi:hypothetical protein
METDLSQKKTTDEEVAFNVVKLYFEQVARLGFKRKLDLDAIINAYFYTLDRLKKKKEELELVDRVVAKEEERLKTVNTKKRILKEYA